MTGESDRKDLPNRRYVVLKTDVMVLSVELYATVIRDGHVFGVQRLVVQARDCFGTCQGMEWKRVHQCCKKHHRDDHLHACGIGHWSLMK